MSDFTEAGFEPVMLPNGKQKEREGRKVYRIKGKGGRGFDFHIGYVGSGLVEHVPEGFETDELSIPTLKSPGALMKVAGLFAKIIPASIKRLGQLPAALHDYLCEHPNWNRNDADAQFYAALCAVGIPWFWRMVLFLSVTTNKSKERYNEPSMFEVAQLSLFGSRS